jgi:glycosyltransferase involved in cell wall biosynthesis
MKISAIVAPFNEERHIEECLRGLLAQRGVGENLEIIVVDGMSTDRTREIVQSFPEYGTRITMLENPRRLQVYALNIGLRAAIGEYVALISAHAHYGPSYLSSCLDVMNRRRPATFGRQCVGEGDSLVHVEPVRRW